MNRKTYTLLALILLFGIIGFISLRGFPFILLLIPIMALFAGLFGWMLSAVVKRVNSKVWIAMGFLILLGLIIPTSTLFADRETGPVSSLIGTTLYLLPSFALVTSAVLLSAGLPEISSGKGNNRIAVFSRILCALLVLKAFYNLYEFTLWDNTDDGLGYLWLFVPIFAAVLSGVLLFVLLPNRTKLAIFTYILFIPGLLVAVSALAQSVDFHQETEKRAERTAQAIERFYAREGRYPNALSELAPRYLLSVPKPMIIYGQDWCYENGQEYYRLGYIDREHWSDPRLIGRVYSAAGETPGSGQMCMEEFNTVQSRDPDFPYTYLEESH